MTTDTEPDNQHRVTMAQAAAATGRHPQTLRRWIKAGKLPGAIKSGEPGTELWTFDLDELMAADKAARLPTTPSTANGPDKGLVGPLADTGSVITAPDFQAIIARLVELERRNSELETELRLLRTAPPAPALPEPLPRGKPWWRRWLGR